MADLIGTGLAYLAAQLKEHASKTVSYSRSILNVVQSVSLSAIKGRSLFEVQGDDGATTSFEATDWLVAPADLVLAAATRTPEPGDRITDGSAVYEVMPFASEPCWRYSDPHRTLLRIHTKLVSDA